MRRINGIPETPKSGEVVKLQTPDADAFLDAIPCYNGAEEHVFELMHDAPNVVVGVCDCGLSCTVIYDTTFDPDHYSGPQRGELLYERVFVPELIHDRIEMAKDNN